MIDKAETTEPPDQVSGSRTHSIQPIVLIVTHPEKGQRILTIPLLPETWKNTDLARLIETVCGDVESGTRRDRPTRVTISAVEPIRVRVNKVEQRGNREPTTGRIKK
jgi:hypothetical protein